MQNLVFSYRDSGMTTLVVLVSIIATYIIHVSVLVNVDFIYMADSQAFANEMRWLGFLVDAGACIGKAIFAKQLCFCLLLLCCRLETYYNATSCYDVFILRKTQDGSSSFLPLAARWLVGPRVG